VPRESQVRRVPTELIPTAVPAIHVHLPESIKLTTASILQGIDNTVGGSQISAYASDSDENDNPISISQILSSLHATYPALNYLQYEDTLRERGICYAINIGGLDSDFFVNKVGMAEGAVGLFLEQATKQIRKEGRGRARRKMKGKKRARTEGDKENIDPQSSCAMRRRY